MSKRYFEGTEHAELYAKYRPRSPQQVIDRIINYLKEKYDGELLLGLDVGCGNGQCSALLSPHFKQILATDISSAQIEVAKTLNHPSNVEFQVSPAEQSQAKDASVQLVNSAVAAHWFDLPLFFQETNRILCSNGVIALSDYDVCPLIVHPTKSDQLTQALHTIYADKLDAFDMSKGGVQLVANMELPFEDVVKENIWVEEKQTLADLVGYIITLSMYQNFCQANGEEAGQELLDQFITKCLIILDSIDIKPENVQLVIKRKWFLLMGRKH